jgi:hypothetical protein
LRDEIPHSYTSALKEIACPFTVHIVSDFLNNNSSFLRSGQHITCPDYHSKHKVEYKVVLGFGGHGVGSVAAVPVAADHAHVLFELFNKFFPPQGKKTSHTSGVERVDILVEDRAVGKTNVHAVGIKASAIPQITKTVDWPSVPPGAVGFTLMECVTTVAQDGLAQLDERQ